MCLPKLLLPGYHGSDSGAWTKEQFPLGSAVCCITLQWHSSAWRLQDGEGVMDKVVCLWVKRETHVHISIPGRGQCAHGVAADLGVKIPPPPIKIKPPVSVISSSVI